MVGLDQTGGGTIIMRFYLRGRAFAPLLLGAGVLLPAQAHAAGGAFAVDDVEIGKPGDCKVESWASIASNHDFIAVTSPACVVKLGIPVELGGQLQRSRGRRRLEHQRHAQGQDQYHSGCEPPVRARPCRRQQLGLADRRQYRRLRQRAGHIPGARRFPHQPQRRMAVRPAQQNPLRDLGRRLRMEFRQAAHFDRRSLRDSRPAAGRGRRRTAGAEFDP